MSRGFLPQDLRLPSWCIAVLALIIIATAAAVPLLRHQLVTAPHHQAIGNDLRSRAEHYATVVNAHIGELDALLDRLMAESDPAGALAAHSAARPTASPERSARNRVADNTVARWQASANRSAGGSVELFLLGDNPDTFSLRGNYIAETLYEQVLAGKSPSPQAAMVSDWRLYLARPVIAADDIVGAVILRTPITPLQELLVAASDGLDHIELLQQARGGRTGRLVTAGPASTGQFSAQGATRIANWQVRVHATAPLLAGIKPPVIAFGAVQLGLWSLALLLCALLLKAKLRFRHSASPDQQDDLFSEHFIREAPSFLDPLPTAREDTPPPPHPAPEPVYRYPRHVFRDYDIRGRAGEEISADFAEALGRVLGTVALERGEDTLAVGMDGRCSGPELCEALCRGILSTGCDVVRIGMVPTPVLNFALTGILQTHSGVMVTASHNPAADNGFKIILDNHVLSSDEILDLHERMEEETWLRGEGENEEASIGDDYLDAVTRDILPPAGLKLVIDCGNGVTSLLAPELFRRLDCEVVELYCEVDGEFPNHQPDPTVAANLEALIAQVAEQDADLGLAFDGDGDRLVAVTASGRIVWPDELLMIFVRDILTRQPGADIVYDVKCTRRLHGLISSHGGRPVMWKTGHAHMRNKVAESGAPVGGEFSGHLFFNDRWHGFDDGLYAAARLLEILGFREQGLDDIIATFPQTVATAEIRVAVSEEEKFAFVEALRVAGNFSGGTLINIDGIRVEYPDGWGLIRVSNTAPALTLRFEADDPEALDRIKTRFRNQLYKLDDSLSLDF